MLAFRQPANHRPRRRRTMPGSQCASRLAGGNPLVGLKDHAPSPAPLPSPAPRPNKEALTVYCFRLCRVRTSGTSSQDRSPTDDGREFRGRKRFAAFRTTSGGARPPRPMFLWTLPVSRAAHAARGYPAAYAFEAAILSRRSSAKRTRGRAPGVAAHHGPEGHATTAHRDSFPLRSQPGVAERRPSSFRSRRKLGCCFGNPHKRGCLPNIDRSCADGPSFPPQ